MKLLQHQNIYNNRQILITCSRDETVKIFYFNPKNVKSPIDVKSSFKIWKHSNWVRALLVFPEEQRLVSGGMNKELKLWNLKKMNHVKNFSAINSDIRSLCHLTGNEFAAGT